MSRYRAIDVRIWFDDKFPKLSDDAKLLFFFLISNPRGTMLGIAVQGKTDIAEFLGWSTKRLAKPFAELLRERLFEWDEKTRTIYLPHFLKYNPIENENQAKGAMKCLDDIPQECPYFQDVKRFLERLGKPFLKPLAERLPERLPKQEEEPGEGEESEEGKNILRGLNGKTATNFESFWKSYPKRKGKIVGPKETVFNSFKRLSESEQAEIQVAVSNYGKSQRVQEGFARDPIRFLKDDFWKNWVEPETEEAKNWRDLV